MDQFKKASLEILQFPCCKYFPFTTSYSLCIKINVLSCIAVNNHNEFQTWKNWAHLQTYLHALPAPTTEKAGVFH